MNNSAELDLFLASLAALKAVGAVSSPEAFEWEGRMCEALGLPSSGTVDVYPDLSRRVVTHFVGDPGESGSALPDIDLVLLRTIKGPPAAVDLLGGSFRVVTLEVFTTGIAVIWKLEPLPATVALFPQEMTALERDLDGLSESDRQDVSEWAETRYRATTDAEMKLIDDCGTPYSFKSTKSRINRERQSGWSYFEPVPRPNTTRVSVGWVFQQVQSIELPFE